METNRRPLMKRLMAIIGLILVVALLIGACGSQAVEERSVLVERGESREDMGMVVEYEEEAVFAPAEPAPPMAIKGAGMDEDLTSVTERMIVRTGDVVLVVEDVSLAIEQITGMTAGFDGYVVNSRVWKDGERLVGSISIRVEAEYFDDAIGRLRELAVDVTSESSTSRDVTEEYVDLSARLDNLEATEKQLLVIMVKAETVEDILNVQRELSRVRGDIEQTKARMQYLERTSATSLINIHLTQSIIDIEFTADKRRGLKEGEKIQFTVHQIAGGFAPYSYEWDFGDGDISTDETPVHSYKKAGSYDVSLTITDDRGNTDVEIRTNYIFVITGWNAGNIAGKAWNGLVTFGQGLVNLLIWLAVFSPIWIAIGVVVFLLIRWRRRRKKAD